MGVLEVAVLLLGVAAIASVSGYAGSALSRRRKRRPHTIFLLGVFCGAFVGSALRARPRRLPAHAKALLRG